MVPIKLPPRIPEPVARVNDTIILVSYIGRIIGVYHMKLAHPLQKDIPTIGESPPFINVTANLVGGAAVPKV